MSILCENTDIVKNSQCEIGLTFLTYVSIKYPDEMELIEYTTFL